jgi:hypothetical protein
MHADVQLRSPSPEPKCAQCEHADLQALQPLHTWQDDSRNAAMLKGFRLTRPCWPILPASPRNLLFSQHHCRILYTATAHRSCPRMNWAHTQHCSLSCSLHWHKALHNSTSTFPLCTERQLQHPPRQRRCNNTCSRCVYHLQVDDGISTTYSTLNGQAHRACRR